jgi:hypothetical protein
MPVLTPISVHMSAAYVAARSNESRVQAVLQSTGVVSGEFGLVEAYKQKRESLVPWLSDEDEKVRAFAAQYIKSLDLQIAAEQRRSEEDIEMRKRMYDDPSNEDDEHPEE